MKEETEKEREKILEEANKAAEKILSDSENRYHDLQSRYRNEYIKWQHLREEVKALEEKRNCCLDGEGNHDEEIKEGNFDIKDMVEIIKNKYENMKKREMTMENANVIGHVVYNFCTMQDADRINFFDSYNDIKLDGEHICTCDIMIDGKSIMSIITSPTKTSNDKSMKWLYNYMKKTGASRGIVIKGTVWSMVDADGVEYNIDFDKNVDEKVFEKFLI